MSNLSLFKVKQAIEHDLNRKLNDKEHIMLIKQMRKDKLDELPVPDMKQVLDEYVGVENPDKEKDKVVIEREVINNIQQLFSIDSIKQISKMLNPKRYYKSIYLLLDTNNASDILSEGTKYRWNFRPDSQLLSGTVNGIGVTNKLVGMRIYPMKTDVVSQPERVFTPLDFKITITKTGMPELYYNDFTNLNSNFTILVEEFQAQSYVGKEGRKFHFVLYPFLMNPEKQILFDDWTPLDPYYEFVTSGKGNGEFWFRTPITEFSTITISMGNPFVVFPLSKTVRTLIPLELMFLDED